MVNGLADPRGASHKARAMKMKRYLPNAIAALTTVLFPLAALRGAEPVANAATTPVLHKGTEKRIEQFNGISKKGEAQLVFLGDSITQGWDGHPEIWTAAWGHSRPANFGISGDKTENVLWRLDNGNFDGLKPKLIVIMIGTNNTGHRDGNEPAAQTAEGVKAIIERLQKKCPGAGVLLLGIFPRGEKPDDKLRLHNAAINEHLAKFADGKAVHYMDIGKAFLQPDGTLPADVMPDRLHLSKKGYQIWADSIKDKVAELMK
jgi:lysophospholipase L1-like esterase